MTEQEKEWLRHGERGISSEAIFSRLSGVPILEDRNGWGTHPCDPADFRRCELLLDAIPTFRARLTEMKEEEDEVWTKLVEKWGEIVACFNKECPDWKTQHDWSAPKTYQLMKSIGC